MSVWVRVALTALAALPVLLAACNSSPGGRPPVTGVHEICQPLAQAERYRYKFGLKLVSPAPEDPVDMSKADPSFGLPPNAAEFSLEQTYAGSFERPNKTDILLTTPGSDDIHLVVIGSKQWNELGGRWIEGAAADAPFPPADMCKAFVHDVALEDVKPVRETVDGVKMLRYDFKGLESSTAEDVWGAGSDPGRLMDTFDLAVWLPADGSKSVLRMESVASGNYPWGRQLNMELSLIVTDFDANNIHVEAPA